MSHRFLLCALTTAAALASSACALGLPSSAEVDGSGVGSGGPQTRTASCGSFAQLDDYAAGSGGVSIQVTDGDGKMVFSDENPVTGEVNNQQNLSGAPGTWTLVVDGDGFAGQFKITLDCP
jgi:hypothetical protein